MFYIEGKDRLIAIEKDNVVSFCPDCGKEIYTDLSKFLKVGNLIDEIFCKDCSKKYL